MSFSSAKSKISIFCRTIQLLRCAGHPADPPPVRLLGPASPAEPLVGALHGGHGSGARPTLPSPPRTRYDGSRTSLRAVAKRASLGPEGLPGSGPGLFSSRSGSLRPAGRPSAARRALAVGGGDEETRTPDPLLAKEMLCQLSYVPIRRGRGRGGGGRFWTRTRDLCLIRAVL